MATKLVKRIDYCYANEYSIEGYPYAGKVLLETDVPWKNVPIVAELSKASLVLSTSTEDRQRFYTATLKFNTCDFPDKTEKMVFLVELTNGEKKVIGNDHLPYCMTEVEEVSPENVTDNQLKTVVATYKSPYYIPSAK